MYAKPLCETVSEIERGSERGREKERERMCQRERE